MIAEKHLALRPLLESSDGIHLTTYFTHPGGIQKLKAQIRETLHVAQLYLQPVMNRAERQRFLRPLHALLKNRPLLSGLRGNFGLFRNRDSFRLLRIPVKVEPLCVIAGSFHVKPLLQWMQTDREFLLLNVEAEGAQLYHGSQFTLRCLKSVDFAKLFGPENEAGDAPHPSSMQIASDQRRQSINWLREWLLAYQNGSSLRLFLTGEETMTAELLKQIRYNNTAKPALLVPREDRSLSDICLLIRSLLTADARHYLQQAFLEFDSAEAQNLARRSLFQIAKATAQGRVRKLIIAEETQIFGKFNAKTGNILLHAGQFDHADDDILDDLAQAVLAQGGEVVVAPREQIPRASQALAILYDDSKNGANSFLGRSYDYSAEQLRLYG